MSSKISNQVVHIERLKVPTGTGIATNTSPSLPALPGNLAYDLTTPGILFTGDGALWKGSSGSGSTPVFSSITLATAGGTPTPLNYYEEGTFSCPWTGGIVASETIRFSRIGSIVTLRADSLSSAAVSSEPVVATAALPARLRPTAYALEFAIGVLNNSLTPTTPGMVRVGIDGTFGLYLNMNAVVFANTGNAGHRGFSISYCIN